MTSRNDYWTKRCAIWLFSLYVSAGISSAGEIPALAYQNAYSTNHTNLYLSVGAGAMISELPPIAYGELGWAPNTTGALFERQTDITSKSYAGTFDFHAPWLERRQDFASDLRIELHGTWWDGDSSSSLTTQPGTAATYVSVDGSRQVLFGAGSPSALFESEYKGYVAALRLKGDFDIGEKTFLSPSLGVTGGKRRQLHEIDISTPFAGGTMENPIEVK